MDGDSLARLAFSSILLLAFCTALFSMYRGRLSKGLQDAAIWGLIFLGVVTLYGLQEPLKNALFSQNVATFDEGDIVLYREDDGHFHADLRVNGQPVSFLVDTGATGISLSQRDARAVGFDPAQLRYLAQAQTANGLVDIAPVRLESIEFGAFRDTDVRAFVNGGDLGISLLGMGYLDRFARVTLEGDRLILQR
ncbi:MAG: TIGR02281 family clan AA aspartic protease [Pseudomonadota bacterium]